MIKNKLIKLAPGSRHKKKISSGDTGSINPEDDIISTKVILRMLEIIPDHINMKTTYNIKLDKSDPIKFQVLDYDHQSSYPIRVKLSQEANNKLYQEADRPPKSAFTEQDDDGFLWIPLSYLSSLTWQVL